jgi:hypothetical protein
MSEARTPRLSSHQRCFHDRLRLYDDREDSDEGLRRILLEGSAKTTPKKKLPMQRAINIIIRSEHLARRIQILTGDLAVALHYASKGTNI